MEYPSKVQVSCGLRVSEADEEINEELEYYLTENAETERRKILYPTVADEEMAMSLSRPLTPEKAFAFFGLMLGTIPPLSFFSLFLISSNRVAPIALLLITLTNLTTATVGYHSGKLIGKFVRSVDQYTFSPRILLHAMIGIAWGAVCGFAGGIFLMLIGAIFGAFIGGAVGAIALPAFSIPYRTMKHGDLIELRHFLPLSLGTALTIAAFVLGFAYR